LLLLRVYAYLFELGLCVFLLGVAAFAVAAGDNNLKLGMLPWEGTVLVRAIAALGIVGIICTLLAMTGAIRWMFPLWTLVVLILMFRGFFLSSYSFSGADQFKFDVLLTAGAFLAFLGSLSLFGRKSSR